MQQRVMQQKSNHDKQNIYDFKEDYKPQIDNLDAQSDQSDIVEHVVYLEDPGNPKGETKGDKIAFKTHIDIDNIDEKNDIVLLINQVVEDIYQFVFVIEHS